MLRRPFSPNRHVLNTLLHHHRQQGGAPPPRSALRPVPKPEKHRTYHYPDGKRLQIHGVERVAAEPFEHTYLETMYGESFMVPSGWTHCDVMSVDEWMTYNWIV